MGLCLLREERNSSQADIEKRTGLLRFRIPRIENGHTVPKLETLEKMAAAPGVPLYQLFYDAAQELFLFQIHRVSRVKRDRFSSKGSPDAQLTEI